LLQRVREVIRCIADRIPVRPGEYGVPVAELPLDEQIALAEFFVKRTFTIVYER